MKRQIKYLAIKLLFLFGLLFLIDCIVGGVFTTIKDLWLDKAPNAFRTEFTIEKVDSDILIIGSSRASHHYIPTILSDSLNRTVFNCGMDGEGLSYSFAMIHGILNRYSPEVIIVDIDPIVFDSEYRFGGLNSLFPYFSDKDDFYKKMIIKEDPTNRYKMLSKMYRYNSRLIPIAYGILLGDPIYDNGYVALFNGGAEYPSLKEVQYKEDDLDSYRIELLMNCITNCKEKNVKLIFSVSPRFQKSNALEVFSFINLRELLANYNIPLIYMGDNSIINDSTMYKDESHLNHKGAEYFSEIFAGRLKKEMKYPPLNTDLGALNY